MSEIALQLPNQIVHSTIGDINLIDLARQTPYLILYFYPKDNTAGCSKQAVQFSQYYAEFQQHHAQIIGISRDSLKSHQRFIENQNIPFPLISDTDEVLCQHFDVIKEKNMYGKKVMGIERSTFIFQGEKLIQIYRKVKADGHAEQVLNDLIALAKLA